MKLAFKGTSANADKLNEILISLGGHNSGYKICNGYFYYIDDYNNITGTTELSEYCEWKIFTYEEFIKKYPYKINDLVDRNLDYVSCIIKNMRWNSDKCCIEYFLKDLNSNNLGWHIADCFINHKDYRGCNTDDDVVSGIYLNDTDYADEVELWLGNYEIEVRDGKTYAVKKKSVYPKTYDECYDEDNTELHFIYVDKNERDLYESFIQLIRCRNTYWKMAGEQMGLDKPWESPLPSLFETVYCIRRKNNEIIKGSYRGGKSEILEFPTTEMRDAFYDNFKELIEHCKELL